MKQTLACSLHEVAKILGNPDEGDYFVSNDFYYLWWHLQGLHLVMIFRDISHNSSIFLTYNISTLRLTNCMLYNFLLISQEIGIASVGQLLLKQSSYLFLRACCRYRKLSIFSFLIKLISSQSFFNQFPTLWMIFRSQ